MSEAVIQADYADRGGHGNHGGPATGLARWLFTTNHKDIGTLYLRFALVMLFVGGAMSLVIRAELFQPGLQFVNPDFFNQMTMMHALIMVFGMIMPFAGVMLLSTLFMEVGGPASGWTLLPGHCGARPCGWIRPKK